MLLWRISPMMISIFEKIRTMRALSLRLMKPDRIVIQAIELN